MRTDAYKFVLQQHLDPALADSFRSIPGVGVWRKRPGMFVPSNAGWLVQHYLDQRGIAYTVKPPQSPVIEVVPWELTDLQKGIWSDFMLDFQRQVAIDRVATGGGHVFAPAGSGKTIIAIAWALAASGPVLAITKSKARRQWCAEVRRFTTLEPFALMPSADYRKRDKWRTLLDYLAWCRDAGQRPFVVMGWAGLREHLSGVLAMVPTSVVFDESHKGRQKRRAKYTVTVDTQGNERFDRQAMGNTSDLASRLAVATPRRLTTSASPIVNRLVDVWAQLTMVEPNGWGVTSRKFEFRHCNATVGDYGGVVYAPPGTSHLAELEQRMSFTTSRVPYKVLADQLPPKRRMVTRIPASGQTKPEAMSREDRIAYKKEIKELGIVVADGGGNRWKKARMAELLRLDASERKRGFIRDRVPELITMGKGKVLVFTGRKRSCAALEKTIRGTCRGLQVWMAHGDTPAKEFERIHTAYMAHPGPCVLIGTYQAWGESLNLQDTDHMLISMLPITPGEVEQTEGRGARLGQTRPYTVEYLIAEHTIDERLASILLDKMPAVEQVTRETAGIAKMAAALKGTDDLDGLLDALVADMGDWEQ